MQLSINAEKGFGYHLELGAKLAPLRERGVLIVGSGNIEHNLGGMDRARPHDGFDWAQRFDEDAKLRMLVNPTDVGRLDAHRDFRSAVPTPDHFLPLLYLADWPVQPVRPLGLGGQVTIEGPGAAEFPESVPVDGSNT